MLKHAHIPILGFAAFSGTGKTTLLVKLLSLLKQGGYRVGVVKHAHHSFDIDEPGKDSHEARRAGARQVLVGSRQRWALIAETEDTEEPQLDMLLRHLDQDDLDLILVEGFKSAPLPKIELHRPSLGHPVMYTDDQFIIAIASDAPLSVARNLPVLDLNRPDEIVKFILGYLFGSADRAPTASTGKRSGQAANES